MATITTPTTLGTLVHEIALENPEGLRHADFVRKVLESGYIHKGSQPVSTSVHQILRQMCEEGVMVRSEDQSRGVREYAPACSC